MRKLLPFLLLAGVAAPAIAAGDPGDDNRFHANREAREARSEARSEARAEARSEVRVERTESDNRPHFNVRSDVVRDNGGDRPQPVVHVETSVNQPNVEARGRSFGGFRQDRTDGGEPRARSFGGFRQGRPDGGEQQAVLPSGQDNGAAERVRAWRERQSGGPRIITPDQIPNQDRNDGLREQRRPMPNVFRNRIPVVSNVPHEGTQPPLRAESWRSRHSGSWNTSWRNDRRFDWQDHRRHHRSLFHLGFYYDPFGWNYRPYQIGWRLWPSYYSNRYWISDPWEYRLPYAPPGTVWIRYWDDAVLVDTYTGEVVDVIRDFFW